MAKALAEPSTLGDGAHGMGGLGRAVCARHVAGSGPHSALAHGLGSLVLTGVTGCPGEVWAERCHSGVGAA